LITDARRERIRRSLLALCVICALALVFSSFQPWFSGHAWGFGASSAFEIRGNQLSNLSPYGDGYLVILAAAITIVLAIAALMRNEWQPILAAGLSVAGAMAIAIPTYYVRSYWASEYFNLDIDVEPALWATLLVGAVITMSGLVLLVVPKRQSKRATEAGGA